MELPDFRNDSKVQQLRQRSAEMKREQTTLDRAVDDAQAVLDRAHARWDEVEAAELLGDASSRDLARAKRELETADAAFSEASAAAGDNRRRHAKLMGQRATIEDRARATVRTKIEAALRDALTKHAAAAIALAESQKQLDAMRAAVDDQFGIGTTVVGETRRRGWGSGPTGSPRLLPCAARFKDFPREVDRFLEAARAEGIRV